MTAIRVGQLWQVKKDTLPPVVIEAVHASKDPFGAVEADDLIVYRLNTGFVSAVRRSIFLANYELKPDAWEVNRKYRKTMPFATLTVTVVDKEGNALIKWVEDGSVGVRTPEDRKNYVEIS